MAEPYDTLRFNIVSRFTDMYSNWNGVVTECGDLADALNIDGNPTSETACDAFGVDLGAVRNNWGAGSSTLQGRLLSMFDYLNDSIGSSVTMSSILSAMMAATFEELTQFMGITQAFKVAVWDAPFNEEFYAALARGFKTWGAT